MDKSHKRIWLEPQCCAESDTGRTWCQDPDNWDHDIDDEPGHDTPTEYVRADLFSALQASHEFTLMAHLKRIKELEASKAEQRKRIDNMYDIRESVTAMQRAKDFNYWMGGKLTWRAVAKLAKHFNVLENKIKELEDWEDTVRRCAPEVAQVADSEAVEILIGKK